MRYLLITKNAEMQVVAREGLHPSDELVTFDAWPDALEASKNADMMFVDLIATLDEPNQIAGYERFAHAKMAHPTAAAVPLVLIGAPPDYELDFMAGWPNFVLGHLQQPISVKLFRRASTWV
ncbi:MAG: hypothetical protein ACYC96_15635 [Fimbriimonadaceae bacterium]